MSGKKVGLLKFTTSGSCVLNEDTQLESVICAESNKETHFFVTVSGRVMAKNKENNKKHFVELFCDLPIIKLACNDWGALMVSNSRQVFGFGNDPLDSGVLCQHQFLKKPQILAELDEYEVFSISMGNTHAAAVDSYGRLITWGSFPGGQSDSNTKRTKKSPGIVHASMLHKLVDVSCMSSFICVVTLGGSVFLIGEFPHSQHQQSLNYQTKESVAEHIPFCISEIENYLVLKAVCQENFIAILTDLGNVLVINQNFYVQELSFSGHIKELICSKDAFYGITEDSELCRWVFTSDWNCFRYKFDGEISGNLLLFNGLTPPDYEQTVKCHKTNQLTENMPRLKRKVKTGSLSLRANHDYSQFLGSYSYQKIIELRENCYRRNVLINAFWPIAKAKLKIALKAVKQRAALNKMYLKWALIRALERTVFTNMKNVWDSILKYIAPKRINEKIESNITVSSLRLLALYYKKHHNFKESAFKKLLEYYNTSIRLQKITRNIQKPFTKRMMLAFSNMDISVVTNKRENDSSMIQITPAIKFLKPSIYSSRESIALSQRSTVTQVPYNRKLTYAPQRSNTLKQYKNPSSNHCVINKLKNKF